MKRLFGLMVVAAAATLAVAPASPAVGLASSDPMCVVALPEGHVDALDVDWTGSALDLALLDYVPNPDVRHDPDCVELVVRPAAQTTIPSNMPHLGNPGDPVWILPQSEPDATALDVLWLGYNAHGVPSGVLQGNTMTIELVSVSGPNGFSVFTIGFGGSVNRLLDSEETATQFRTEPLNVNVHGHAFWAFEAAGTYQVTFRVTATKSAGGTTSDTEIYTFTV